MAWPRCRPLKSYLLATVQGKAARRNDIGVGRRANGEGGSLQHEVGISILALPLAHFQLNVLSVHLICII